MFAVCLRRNSRRPSAVGYCICRLKKISTTDFGNVDRNFTVTFSNYTNHNLGKLNYNKKKEKKRILLN